MTTFYLVRHAEKESPASLLSGRAPGAGLSAAGRGQAERIAEILAARPIRRVLSSPLERALSSAKPTARRFGLEVERSEALGDVDYGAWTDRTVESLEDGDQWRRYSRFRSGHRIPSGELLLEVQLRAVNELLRLREAVPEGGIALFSHADPIRLVIAWAAGAPIDLCDRFEIGSASISTVVLEDWGPRIVEVNRLV